MSEAPQKAEQELSAALSSLAPRLRADATRVEALQRLSGGATQEIWRCDLVGPPGRTPLILRREPAGRTSVTAVGLEMEAALIAAAGAKGVPVPPVRHVLEPEDGLGRGFIMDFIEGETLGGRIVKAEALAPARLILARQCGEIHGPHPCDRSRRVSDAAGPVARRFGGAVEGGLSRSRTA